MSLEFASVLRPLSKAAPALAVLLALCDAAYAADGDDTNSGQDLTNPVQRIDVRAGMTRTPRGRYAYPSGLRYDKPVALGEGWKLGLRFDAAFNTSNVISKDNPDGDYHFGVGDTALRALLIKTIDQRSAFVFGSSIVAPSATEDQIRTGRWQLVPTLGYRYSLPEISAGSFFSPTIRYAFDAAGDARAAHISSLQFAPTFNISLPERAFVTFFSSTDIRYDYLAESWFVPFDIQVGKVWGNSIVTSVQFEVPMVRGSAPLFDYKFEGRVGILF
jgi:hypothetical protein